MKILVGVKLVPKVSDVRFVAGLNRIDRESVGGAINPPDMIALSAARSLARGRNDEVVAAPW